MEQVLHVLLMASEVAVGPAADALCREGATIGSMWMRDIEVRVERGGKYGRLYRRAELRTTSWEHGKIRTREQR